MHFVGSLCHTGAAIKRNAELFFPAEFADDFPVSLQISDKYGLIYVITKLGLLFVYDLETATAVYRNRISPDPIFLAVNSESTGGFYAINRYTRSHTHTQRSTLRAARRQHSLSSRAVRAFERATLLIKA